MNYDCNKTDLEIIDKIKSWDIDVYYCLVEKYSDKLLKYISRITNIDLEEAENLLQEVFIKAYKNINDYDKSYNFSSWIYRICHNLTIDFFRKNKNKEAVSLETDEEYKDLIEILDSWVNLEHDLQDKELLKKIREVINSLDIRYREVIVLKFLEDRSYDEISDILKIPSWTVATFINRAKKQFRQKAKELNLENYL